MNKKLTARQIANRIAKLYTFCSEGDCHTCPKYYLCSAMFGQSAPSDVIHAFAGKCEEFMDREEIF